MADGRHVVTTMPDLTPAEIEAGAKALDRLVIEHPRAGHEAASRWVLRAVLPDRDARVRAQVAEEIAKAIDRAELNRALVVGESPPRTETDARYQRGASDAARRDAAIARSFASRGDTDG